MFLSLRAEPATPEDLPAADDLLETLKAHKDDCVGMAANMIGVKKRIIAFVGDGEYRVMFNPEIIKNPGLTRRRRVACPLTAPVRQSDGNLLRCSIRIEISRFGSRLSPVSRRRSSSMNSITATGLLSESDG